MLCGIWDLLKPGIEPTSPALAGGFFTPGPPGKARIGFWGLGGGEHLRAIWHEIKGPQEYVTRGAPWERVLVSRPVGHPLVHTKHIGIG